MMTRPSGECRPIGSRWSSGVWSRGWRLAVAAALGLGLAAPVSDLQSRSTPVEVIEGYVEWPSYGWADALTSEPSDPFYPYERLDWDRVGPVETKRLATITLANEHLALTLTPELGGRIAAARWRSPGDAPSTDAGQSLDGGHDEVFYRNPVLKPTRWGERGWWLATGGIEFCFPTQEHGLNEYVAWQTRVDRDADGGVTVTVSDNERTTGAEVAVGITLKPGEPAFRLTPRLRNPTDRVVNVQFWVNAMLALDPANRVDLAATRVAFPGVDTMIVHDATDPAIPGARSAISWPNYQGRDLGWLGSWAGYIGLFGHSPGLGLMGAFNHATSRGIVRQFPPAVAKGVKVFGFGPGFDTTRFTDDGSSYFELWGGLTPTFWDHHSLQPGEVVAWTERWVPIRDGDTWLTEIRARQTPLIPNRR